MNWLLGQSFDDCFNIRELLCLVIRKDDHECYVLECGWRQRILSYLIGNTWENH
jgi:hypothetical protein